MRFRAETLLAKLRGGDVLAAVEYVREVVGRVPPERVYPVAWKLLRAWSALLSLFGRGVPPDARSLSLLEAFLSDLAVELIVLARRGLIEEDLAYEAVKLLVGDEIISMIRACRRGACKPRDVVAYAGLLKLAGEALAGASGESGDCIPA